MKFNVSASRLSVHADSSTAYDEKIDPPHNFFVFGAGQTSHVVT
jgi:hypothetical protein